MFHADTTFLLVTADLQDSYVVRINNVFPSLGTGLLVWFFKYTTVRPGEKRKK